MNSLVKSFKDIQDLPYIPRQTGSGFCDLALEGGGTKLIGHVGAYAALTARGFTLSHAAGTSGGSIVAAAAVAGYTPAELRRLVMGIDFNKFLDGSKWTKYWRVLSNYGLYRGDAFYQFMKQILADKGVYTFKDLLSHNQEEHDNPKYRWRLKVVASDISNGRMIVLPNDAALYGQNPDDMEVALAVRMSMSIPLFFEPVKFEDSYMVDGGVLSNFPISIWDSDGVPDWPTFGLLLKEEGVSSQHEIEGPFSMLKAIISTMLEAHDKRFVRPMDYQYRTIPIPTGKISPINFSLTAIEKERLYHAGYMAAINFLNNWEWEDYRNWAVSVRTGT
jgi:NTE family protein